jgi:hypothetical protein
MGLDVISGFGKGSINKFHTLKVQSPKSKAQSPGLAELWTLDFGF